MDQVSKDYNLEFILEIILIISQKEKEFLFGIIMMSMKEILWEVSSMDTGNG